MIRNARAASAWMLGASLSFALMAICLKSASAYGMPLGQLLFYRGAVSALAIAAILKFRQVALASPHWRSHLKRGVIGFFSMVTFFYAIRELPVATAVTLNYTAPLWLGLILLSRGRQQSSRALLTATLLGFIGVGLMLRPTFDDTKMHAALIALGSGVIAAFSVLNVRAIGRMNEDPMRTVFWFAQLITIAALPGFLFSAPLAVSSSAILYVVLAGLLATVGQWMFTLAYQYGHAQVVSLMGYSQVIFSSLLGVVLFGDRLSWMSWLGMVVIILSGAAATLLVRMRIAAPSPPGGAG
jgi:drug/metabolite transporter (DMT)-like permease